MFRFFSFPLRKQFHYLHLQLTKDGDGSIEQFNTKWISSSPTQSQFERKEERVEMKDEERVFVDDDLSVSLFDAVKQLGNPATIGDIYSISWQDIIQGGFTKREDFERENIHSLAELEEFIVASKKKENEQK